MIKRQALLIPYCVLLWLMLPVACGPAPEPTPDRPQPTAELPTLPPVVTVPPAPATLTPIPTTTPLPYPSGTPEPFLPEGESAVEPRLGVAATLGKGVLFCDGRDWQSWWAPSWAKNQVNCEGLTTLPQHVPMLVWSPSTFEQDRARQTFNKFQPMTWLVFNECEHEHQCNTTPEDAARWYHDVGVPFAHSLSPDTRLIVGGVNAGPCGMEWMEQFVTYYRLAYGEDVPRAGWHFHLYPELWRGTDCSLKLPWGWNWAILHDVDVLWREWLRHADSVKRFTMEYGREGDEIWISESSCLAPPPAVCRDHIYTLAERMLAYYDTDGRWITRYTWFADGGLDGNWDFLNLWSGNHEGEPLAIRPLGELWLHHEPLPAVPMTIYRRYFPILGYGADVVPQPRPEATPPGGYP